MKSLISDWAPNPSATPIKPALVSSTASLTPSTRSTQQRRDHPDDEHRCPGQRRRQRLDSLSPARARKLARVKQRRRRVTAHQPRAAPGAAPPPAPDERLHESARHPADDHCANEDPQDREGLVHQRTGALRRSRRQRPAPGCCAPRCRRRYRSRLDSRRSQPARHRDRPPPPDPENPARSRPGSSLCRVHVRVMEDLERVRVMEDLERPLALADLDPESLAGLVVVDGHEHAVVVLAGGRECRRSGGCAARASRSETPGSSRCRRWLIRAAVSQRAGVWPSARCAKKGGGRSDPRTWISRNAGTACSPR